MKRRSFIFQTAQASLMLSPLLRQRVASAQNRALMRGIFFVDGGSYAQPEDFFPQQTGTDFTLAPILKDFEDLKQDMVIVQGVDIRSSGPNPKGNNHVRSMGKVLTAANIRRHSSDSLDGLPGNISIDQHLTKELGLRSMEFLVHSKAYNHMRARPFATGPGQFALPDVNPIAAWDTLFRGFDPGSQPTQNANTSLNPQRDLAQEARIRNLQADLSVLDSVVGDLKRLRLEFVGDEKIKLDSFEDAIRSAEKSVRAQLELENSMAQNDPVSPAKDSPNTGMCAAPSRPSASSVPARSQAMFDLIYAALACNRIQIAGMMFGYSSIQWRYEWVDGVTISESAHGQVYHPRDSSVQNLITGWNWNELGRIVRKLKQTPDFNGTMLDNTLIYGTSHFGLHHNLGNIPVVFIGNAQGRLKTGRSLSVQDHTNARSLASVAQLFGLNATGFGDEPNSGGIEGLIV